MYFNFADSCLMRAEGKQSEADYIADKSYFEYFWGQVLYNRYCEKMKKELEKNKT